MAEWKKIIVSGSEAHLLNVTASGLAPSGNDELLKAGSNGELELSGITLSADGGITGSSFTGSFTGDGSGLTGVAATSFDIDALSAGTTIEGTDQFIYSDGGTEKKVAYSVISSSIYGGVSGDATIAAGGALTIAADSVENSMLANMSRGTVKVGGTSNAPTDLDAKTSGQILVGDGTDINSVAVSGDVTLANDGAVTIANDAVDNNKLANIARGSVKVGGTGNAPTDLDAKTSGQILVGDGTDIVSVAVSGDVTLAADGAVTIANDAVETAMIAHSLGTAGTHQFTGSFSGDGSGLTGLDTTLSISGSSGGGSVALGSQVLTIAGTANEITATAANQTITIGLPDDVTIGGNLNVLGTTTTINTANLLVEDRFALFNSGSASGDGGFIVQTESDFSGVALGYDDSEGRFGLQIGTKLAQNAGTLAPDAYIASVVTSADANYQKNGNIRVESGDIYIYVE